MEFLQEFEDYSACSLEGLKIDSQRYANAEQTLDSEKKTLVNEVFNKEVNQFNKFRDCTLSSKGDSLNDNGKGDIRKLLGRIVAIRQSGNEEDLIKLRKDFQINATKSIVCNARYLILRSLGEFHIKANNFDTAEIFLSEALKMNLAGSWKIEIQKQLQTAKTTTPTLASTPTPAITTTTPVSAHEDEAEEDMQELAVLRSEKSLLGNRLAEADKQLAESEEARLGLKETVREQAAKIESLEVALGNSMINLVDENAGLYVQLRTAEATISAHEDEAEEDMQELAVLRSEKSLLGNRLAESDKQLAESEEARLGLGETVREQAARITRLEGELSSQSSKIDNLTYLILFLALALLISILYNSTKKRNDGNSEPEEKKMVDYEDASKDSIGTSGIELPINEDKTKSEPTKIDLGNEIADSLRKTLNKNTESTYSIEQIASEDRKKASSKTEDADPDRRESNGQEKKGKGDKETEGKDWHLEDVALETKPEKPSTGNNGDANDDKQMSPTENQLRQLKENIEMGNPIPERGHFLRDEIIELLVKQRPKNKKQMLITLGGYRKTVDDSEFLDNFHLIINILQDELRYEAPEIIERLEEEHFVSVLISTSEGRARLIEIRDKAREKFPKIPRDKELVDSKTIEFLVKHPPLDDTELVAEEYFKHRFTGNARSAYGTAISAAGYKLSDAYNELIAEIYEVLVFIDSNT
jgi:hypothetical protein